MIAARLVADAQPRPPIRGPARTGRIERTFARQLRGLAQHVGQLINDFDVTVESLPSLSQLLRAYAESLIPWAQRVASKMIGEVDDRERSSWRALGQAISRQLHYDLSHTPVGDTVRSLLDEQVTLITSIPTKAAERVHELTLQGLETSARAREVAREIARSSEVTAARATLIARTETSRTATALLQARCESIGATHYIWRSQHDRDTRPGHRAMDGKVCEWANPPLVDEGGGRFERQHPGCFPNCRCYASPVIADPYAPPSRRRSR